MSKKMMMTNEFQREWVERLEAQTEAFKEHRAENDRNSSFPKRNVAQLVEMGYTRLPMEKALGENDMTMRDFVSFQETIGAMDSATALSIGWHQGISGEIFDKKLWNDEMTQFLADEIRNGALINRALSEAATGSPTRGGKPGTVAVRTENGWKIDGRKSFTTMSPVLTYFLVSAWVEEQQQVGTFLVPKAAEGVTVIETWDMLGMRATESHDLLLEHVEIPDDYYVERDPKSRNDALNPWSLHIPACYLGIAQAARDEALRFAVTYQPNSINTPICELPNVQQHIGQMDIELMQMRHLLYGVADILDDDARKENVTTEMAVAKYTVTNGALSVVDRAMRLVGARSLQMSNPLQQMYRDVRAGLHNPPMDDMTIANTAKAAIAEMKNILG